jgi:RimJ/RimL family protein N-acetyltransferase
MLDGKMITLRPISPADAPIIKALKNDCTSYRDEWITPQDDEAFVKDASVEIAVKQQGWHIITNDKSPIGVLRIAASPTKAGAMDISYAVADSHRGQGHATDAVLAGMRLFQGCATRFIIQIDEANHSSVRIARKCGFTLMAKHEQAIDYGMAPKGNLLVFERIVGSPGGAPGFHT